MARQPFLPTYKDAPSQMGPDLIETLPKVAELVGRIAINWSGVELHLSLALGSLLGVESTAAVAVFLSLRNHRAQRDALQAAAEKTLTGELKELFDAILHVHKELDKQRNDVVHCVWGRSEATPDGIIWSSLQDHANMLINDYYLERTGSLVAEDRPAQITKNYFVFRYYDLEKLNSEIIMLGDAVRNFHAHFRYQNQPAGTSAYRDLLNEPIRVHLDLWYPVPPTEGGDSHGQVTVHRHPEPAHTFGCV
jgi:hypothetical protein